MAKSGKRKAAPGDVATNRQASYRFELLDHWECGIELLGPEVKSLREGGGQLKDAYAALFEGELWLHRMYIAPYRPAARENPEPERVRKLLLNRRELERLVGQTSEKGFTLVPTRVYFRGPWAKVELALGRGKTGIDRRRDLKEREQKREIDRALAERG